VYYHRARLYGNRQEYAKAIADYTRILEFEPNRFDPRFSRAINYRNLRQFDQAIADFSIIIEGETDFSRMVDGRKRSLAMTYSNRGQLYQQLKDYSKAIADYSNGINLDPDLDNLLTIYWRRGRCYVATQQFDKAQEDADLMSRRAWDLAFKDAEVGADALDIARKATQVLDHDTSYQLEVLAAIQAKLGQFDEAVKQQTKAVNSPGVMSAEERTAMQDRLELYRARKPLPVEASSK
jgi:tetratricopeptide (TPR) repeat protein